MPPSSHSHQEPLLPGHSHQEAPFPNRASRKRTCVVLLAKCCTGRPATRYTSAFFFTVLFASIIYTVMLKANKEHYPSFSAVLGGSILGMVSALVVVWFYVWHPRLRTHINTMLFWRTLCDLALALIFFVYCWMSIDAGGPAYWMSIIFEPPANATDDFSWKGHYGDKHVEDWEKDLRLRNPRCTILAMAFQFATFGAELWFFCNAWDLKMAVANPFSSDSLNMRSYHALSWLGAVLMAVLVNLPSGFGFVTSDDDHDDKDRSTVRAVCVCVCVRVCVCVCACAFMLWLFVWLFSLAPVVEVMVVVAVGGDGCGVVVVVVVVDNC